jgi:hypothetical protein
LRGDLDRRWELVARDVHGGERGARRRVKLA